MFCINDAIIANGIGGVLRALLKQSEWTVLVVAAKLTASGAN